MTGRTFSQSPGERGKQPPQSLQMPTGDSVLLTRTVRHTWLPQGVPRQEKNTSTLPPYPSPTPPPPRSEPRQPTDLRVSDLLSVGGGGVTAVSGAVGAEPLGGQAVGEGGVRVLHAAAEP